MGNILLASGSRPTASRYKRSMPRNANVGPEHVRKGFSRSSAQRPDDVGVLGAAAGGDPDELTGLQPLLVIAGPRVDSATNQQPADELVGRQRTMKFDEREIGVGRVNVQPVDLGERAEKAA